MDAAGNLTVLHVFGPYSAGGLRPSAKPVEVSPGVFFGVTPLGGTDHPSYGIVYREREPAEGERRAALRAHGHRRLERA
jgi:hypothetical protein